MKGDTRLLTIGGLLVAATALVAQDGVTEQR